MKIKIEQSTADSLRELLMGKYGVVYDHLDQVSNSPDFSVKLVEIDKDILDVDIAALRKVLSKIEQTKGVKLK